ESNFVRRVNANTFEILLSSFTGRVNVLTGAGDDTVTFDLAGGNPLHAAGLNADLGSGTGDRFALAGAGASSAAGRTGLVEAIDVAGAKLTVAGHESQQVTNVQALTLGTTGGDDSFTASAPSSSQLRITGTKLAALTLTQVQGLTINLGTGDVASAV